MIRAICPPCGSRKEHRSHWLAGRDESCAGWTAVQAATCDLISRLNEVAALPQLIFTLQCHPMVRHALLNVIDVSYEMFIQTPVLGELPIGIRQEIDASMPDGQWRLVLYQGRL